MQERAIVYGVIAWLACWLVDLVIFVARSPGLAIDPILKLVIVLACLVIILLGLARNRWLLP